MVASPFPRLVRAAVLSALVLASLQLPAAQGQPAPVTLQTLRGRWEGISFDEPRVLLLEVSTETRTSALVMAVGSGAYRYRFKSLVVNKGAVRIEAVDESGERLTLAASGVALAQDGRLTGQITWYDLDGHATSLAMTFAKQDGGFVKELSKLVERGERTLSAGIQSPPTSTTISPEGH